MQRYFITFAYDGTAYHGWQIQPNGNSVQEELQKALSTILRENIEVVGAGRTDAGVHARRMTAHFETEANFDCAQLAYKLNRLVPRDIAVYDVYPVDADMHARFSATLRTYAQESFLASLFLRTSLFARLRSYESGCCPFACG